MVFSFDHVQCTVYTCSIFQAKFNSFARNTTANIMPLVYCMQNNKGNLMKTNCEMDKIDESAWEWIEMSAVI